MDKYTLKENYVTRDPNPDEWRTHPNNNILKFYEDKLVGNVLDFGCNHGSCSFLILDNPNVSSVLGLDLNPDAIEIAYETKLNSYSNSKIEFVVKNILEFEYDGKFDSIVSFHTLEHIYPDDVDAVLQKLKSYLIDGGYFVISIPYKEAYDNGEQHVAYYDEISLKSLFEKNNYETIECYYDNRCGGGGILTGLFKKPM